MHIAKSAPEADDNADDSRRVEIVFQARVERLVDLDFVEGERLRIPTLPASQSADLPTSYG
jgi:hypothetical protein